MEHEQKAKTFPEAPKEYTKECIQKNIENDMRASQSHFIMNSSEVIQPLSQIGSFNEKVAGLVKKSTSDRPSSRLLPLPECKSRCPGLLF